MSERDAGRVHWTVPPLEGPEPRPRSGYDHAPPLKVRPADRLDDAPLGVMESLLSKAHDQDAGFDLRYVPANCSADMGRTIGPRPKLLGTGVHLEIPEGYMGEVRPRSGLSKEGVYVALGTIDPGFTGEVMVTLQSPGGPYSLLPYERVAQLVVVPVYPGAVEFVTELPSEATSIRKQGGFGSSGRV